MTDAALTLFVAETSAATILSVHNLYIPLFGGSEF